MSIFSLKMAITGVLTTILVPPLTGDTVETNGGVASEAMERSGNIFAESLPSPAASVLQFNKPIVCVAIKSTLDQRRW